MHELHEAIETLRDHIHPESLKKILREVADNNPDDKALALGAFLETWDVEEGYDDQHFDAQGAEYMVLDDSEADAAEDEYLDQLLDDEGVVEGASSPYFDREAWKRDAKIDGRGHSLAHYDGNEEEYGDFFIYRTN